jgi:hypothetical protein
VDVQLERIGMTYFGNHNKPVMRLNEELLKCEAGLQAIMLQVCTSFVLFTLLFCVT